MFEVSPAGLPPIGLGTWKLTGQNCYQRVRDALDMGYTHVDTAEAYGNEKEIGQAIQDAAIPREALFVTTKIWRNHLSRDELGTAVQRSLERLRTDHVDLLLIHSPSSSVPLEETLEAMKQLAAQQKAKRIGVSNFTPPQWERALSLAPVDYNQVEYHPFLDQEPLKRFANQHQLTLIAYSPLARGRVAREPTLLKIGRRHGKSPAQVALRWLIQHERLPAIPKASSLEHLRENLNVFDFELNNEDIALISRLEAARRRRLVH